MEIEILEQQCGGTEFVPRPHRLHLGAQNAEGVDRLQFILPAAWAGCTLALYLRRSDGVQLAAIPLDADDSVTVDRPPDRQRAGTVDAGRHRQRRLHRYTRPGSYDVYATLPTDAAVRSCRPRCTSSLWRACWKAHTPQRKAPAVPRTVRQIPPCRRHWRKRLRTKFWPTVPMPSQRKAGGGCRTAGRKLCTTGGQVLSVNSKGGAVQLNAQDVGRCRSRCSLCLARWCAFSAWMPPPARCRPIPPRCRTCAPMCAARPCLRRQRPARCGQTGSTALRCGQMPP